MRAGPPGWGVSDGKAEEKKREHLEEVVQLARELDAGRPAADNDGMQQPVDLLLRLPRERRRLNAINKPILHLHTHPISTRKVTARGWGRTFSASCSSFMKTACSFTPGMLNVCVSAPTAITR